MQKKKMNDFWKAKTNKELIIFFNHDDRGPPWYLIIRCNEKKVEKGTVLVRVDDDLDSAYKILIVLNVEDTNTNDALLKVWKVRLAVSKVISVQL